MKKLNKQAKWTILIILLVAATAILSACADISVGGISIGKGEEDNTITASGTISAKEIKISPEMGGMVKEINVEEGDSVMADDVLFKLDDEILKAQYNQAQAAVDAAQSGVYAAEAQLASARSQYELTLQQIRMAEREYQQNAWNLPQIEGIDLPVWYFEKDEKIAALESQLINAESDLEAKKDHLDDVLQSASTQDFLAVEKDMAEAQAAYVAAKITLDSAENAPDNDQLKNLAQKNFDAAEADLKAVQQEYDRILSTQAAVDVLEARADVAVAQRTVDNLQAQLDLARSGDQSLQVRAAEDGVKQAEAAVDMAKANLKQAQASLDTIQIQLEKTVVTTPISGVILARNLEVGELAAPGGVVMVIGELDEVTLTVYVPEDEYGRIKLGSEAIITVDSFPNKSFAGKVVYIADQAEFTPRNVQTTEGRKTTVFAVKLIVPNPNGDLKPGMPADVVFSE
jgi:multidrug efflux pump subunit AcrA (membrane-fusion protein)